MKDKEIILKDEASFRIRVVRKPAGIAGLNSLDFVNEQLHEGQVMDSSTYNFFLTDEELARLVEVAKE